jgi:hypothetical protein
MKPTEREINAATRTILNKAEKKIEAMKKEFIEKEESQSVIRQTLAKFEEVPDVVKQLDEKNGYNSIFPKREQIEELLCESVNFPDTKPFGTISLELKHALNNMSKKLTVQQVYDSINPFE